MAEEIISQEFKLKDIDETRNYLIGKINQNDLMSKKHKIVCATLNCIEQSLILVSVCYFWMCFSFCFCFFSWYSYWYCEF